MIACALALAVAACGEPERETQTPDAPSQPQPEESLERLLPSLVDAVQAKQSQFVMEHIATDFKEDGGLDYHDVRALVEKYALADDVVGARLEKVEVTPGGEGRAHVVSHVAFALGQRLAKGESLPEGSVVYAIEIAFEKREGRWLAVGGRYKRETPAATSPATASTDTR